MSDNPIVCCSESEFINLRESGQVSGDKLYLIEDTPSFIDATVRSTISDDTVQSMINRCEELNASFQCTYCGTEDYTYGLRSTPHCPNCGALMRKIR